MALTGDVVDGKYELGRRIGEGGMGAVYAARHVLTEKHVALKLLASSPTENAASARRFKLEVSVSSSVKHDGVVQVLDAGYDERFRSNYVAMELLEGENFQERLERPETTVGEALEHFRAAVEVLAAAHDVGVIHRDIKPANFFVESRPGEVERVKVLDFGIARRLDEPGATKTGHVVGTATYMSPEQAMNAKRADKRADVWSLGVILYEILAGDPPYVGESSHAVIIEVVTGAHEPLAERRPSLPPSLVELVERCLEKDKRDRPADAGVLLAEFDSVLAAPEVQERLTLSALRPAPSRPELAVGSSQPTAAEKTPAIRGRAHPRGDAAPSPRASPAQSSPAQSTPAQSTPAQPPAHVAWWKTVTGANDASPAERPVRTLFVVGAVVGALAIAGAAWGMSQTTEPAVGEEAPTTAGVEGPPTAANPPATQAAGLAPASAPAAPVPTEDPMPVGVDSEADLAPAPAVRDAPRRRARRRPAPAPVAAPSAAEAPETLTPMAEAGGPPPSVDPPTMEPAPTMAPPDRPQVLQGVDAFDRQSGTME